MHSNGQHVVSRGAGYGCGVAGVPGCHGIRLDTGWEVGIKSRHAAVSGKFAHRGIG